MSTGAFSGRPNTESRLADVVIVGGGISGTLAATALARSGYQICLIDRHAVYPPDFRAEHLDGPQVDQLRRLGFLDDLTVGLHRGETVTLARRGQVVVTKGTINYGLRYEMLVNRARANLPGNVQTITGRVAKVDASDSLQWVRMSDGSTIGGRLIVLATGQGYALGRQTGIIRRTIRSAHSLTFGFNIEPDNDRSFPHSFVVYQREKISDRIDYLAAFTMGGTTRVNLFTYRDYREPWTRGFLADPAEGLAQTLPGLVDVMGAYRTAGPVVARPIDLYTSENYRRGGVVLIGDAFQAACPATGMGMVRLLTDIEQLTAIHVPRWLETPGMGAAKITTFYDDPVKRACDDKAMHDSEYRRAVSTESSLGWRFHRVRVRMVENLHSLRKREIAAGHPRVDSGHSEPSMVAG